MSTDLKVFTLFDKEENYLCPEGEEISGMTITATHCECCYSEIIEYLINNRSEFIRDGEYNATFDTHVVSKENVKRIYNDALEKYGEKERFVRILKKALSVDAPKYYFQIF